MRESAVRGQNRSELVERFALIITSDESRAPEPDPAYLAGLQAPALSGSTNDDRAV